VFAARTILDGECAARTGLRHERGARLQHRGEPADGDGEIVGPGEAANLEIIEQHVITAGDPGSHLGPQRGAPVHRRPVGIERDAVTERLQLANELRIGLPQ